VAFSLVRLSYLALVLLQPAWHFLLPPPFGARLWWLALLATLPLLTPLAGVLRGSLRAMTWGGYLSMLYLLIGVTEAWSNPPQRLPALLQVLLVAIYVVSLLKFSRQGEQDSSGERAPPGG
jgi:uncharacterized membrane protein